MRIIKRLLIAVAILTGMLMPATALAYNPLDPACTNGSQSAVCQQAQGQGSTDPLVGPNGVINKVANIIAIITVIGGTIMVLIGGFFFVTSAGNPENVKKAKDRIVAGLIGIVVVTIAWAIVRFITDRILP